MRRFSPSARTILRWTPSLAWAGIIFHFSSLPGSEVPGRFGVLGHFLGYAVLGGLLYLALSARHAPGRSVALSLLIASAYAVSDEFHQSFVPGRTPDVFDWGVDTIGAFTGALAARGLKGVLEMMGPLKVGQPDSVVPVVRPGRPKGQ